MYGINGRSGFRLLSLRRQKNKETMSNQKVKQPVTAEIIERLDSVLNEMNALYASEKDWERMSDLSEELS